MHKVFSVKLENYLEQRKVMCVKWNSYVLRNVLSDQTQEREDELQNFRSYHAYTGPELESCYTEYKYGISAINQS
jgi:hypothetical protein